MEDARAFATAMTSNSFLPSRDFVFFDWRSKRILHTRPEHVSVVKKRERNWYKKSVSVEYSAAEKPHNTTTQVLLREFLVNEFV